MSPSGFGFADQRSIDQVCNDFEAAWKSGEQPQIEDFLDRFPTQLRLAGLKELVILDDHYRARAPGAITNSKPESTADETIEFAPNHPSLAPQWQDYVRRFPELREVVLPDERDTSPGNSKLIADRFQRLRQHASGGLGKVSVAHDQQFGRQVAVKELHSRLTELPHFRSRFLREAEITGQLEHPGIVPVYHLGRHSNGEPYYVMRLIQGKSMLGAIHQLKEETTPTLSRERRQLLRAFIDVCQAVEYAHSRGIIHRDIKPANIMLGDFGETLLVDWGLAKNIADKENSRQSDRDASALVDDTQIGAVLGTPSYMSPEQAEGAQDQVQTLSDIYNLGATLFHLVTGMPPTNQVNTKRDHDTIELNRSVQSDTRLTTKNGEVDNSLKPLLAVCRKAMQRAPADRYPSAVALANDVELALADEPIAVFRDPVAVRFRRLLERHQALASTTVVATILAVVTLAAISWFNGQHARVLAEKNKTLDEMIVEEKRLRELAEKAEDRSEQTVNFLVNAMRIADPHVNSRDVKIVDILDKSARELERHPYYKTNPLMLAQMADAIGRTYDGLGQFAEARQLLSRSYEIYRNEYGPADRTTLKAGDRLANVLRRLDEPQVVNFTADLISTCRSEYGDDDSDLLQLMQTYAAASRQAGNFQEAIKTLETVIEKRQLKWAADELARSSLMTELAIAYNAAGEIDKAIELSQKVYELRREHLDASEVSTLVAGYNYLALLEKKAPPDSLVEQYDDLLADARRLLGDDHYTTLKIMSSLGEICLKLQDTQRGLELIEESLDRSTQMYGEKNQRTLNAANSLGLAYMNQGDWPKTIEQFEKVYRHSSDTLGDDHPRTLTIANNLASAYRLNEDFEKAIDLFQKTLKAQQAKLGAQHPNTIRSMLNLGGTLAFASRPSEAIRVLEDTYRLTSSSKGADHPYAETSLALQGTAHLDLQQFDSARTVLEKCHASRKKTMPDHWQRYYVMGLLGEAHLGLQNLEMAEQLLVDSFQNLLQRMQRIPVRGYPRVERVRDHLVKLYEIKKMQPMAKKYSEVNLTAD